MDYTMQQIADRIKRAKSVLILSHMRPDGDAIGSALALYNALQILKIRGQVCVETEIPSNLRFVKGVENVMRKPQEEYDLLVTVDCSDAERLGELQTEFFKAKRTRIDTINIDHHVSNTRFAQYNYVQKGAANCLHVAKLIDALGVSLDKAIAEYLLLGLLTDSGNFSHDDVDEECMLLAAKLLQAGADIAHYNYELFKKQSKARAKLFAKTMGGMRYYHDDRFAAITITQKALEECGADQGMTEGFVDFPLNVESVEIAASLLEVRKGQYKISLRSKNYADVNKLAGTFGGGGHVRAAGCMLFGDIEEALDKLSYVASQYLED